MTTTSGLVEVLKRELKSRGITYAHVARKLNLSEASVKRMFSRRDFTLKRLDQVCQLTQGEFSDLAQALAREEQLVSRLTLEQEKEIACSIKLFLVAVCVLNHVEPDQIVSLYDISMTECIQLLVKLDRIGFIRLLPNNRIRLLVSRDFTWLPDGPIQRFFKQHAHTDYFRSSFDRPGEYMLALNGMLSKASSAMIIERLKRTVREFSELHNNDVKLPAGERAAMSLLVAIRHWELQEFAALRRKKPPFATGSRPGNQGAGARAGELGPHRARLQALWGKRGS
ncbi:MAG TPA: helix-turn-helix transcriptional regulator [Burkholderiales bacterium]|nr:helix-turn-helix transcriptional regulator [Burkholderiales bacterium]